MLFPLFHILKESGSNKSYKHWFEKVIFERIQNFFQPQPSVQPINHFLRNGQKVLFRGRIRIFVIAPKLFSSKSCLLGTKILPNFSMFNGFLGKNVEIVRNECPSEVFFYTVRAFDSPNFRIFAHISIKY